MKEKNEFLLKLENQSDKLKPLKFQLFAEDKNSYGNSKFTSSYMFDIPSIRISFSNMFFNGFVPNDTMLIESNEFQPYVFLNDKFDQINIHYFNFIGNDGLLCYFTFNNDKLKSFLFELYCFSDSSIEKEYSLLNIKDNNGAEKRILVKSRLCLHASNFKEYFENISFINNYINYNKYFYRDAEKNSIFLLSLNGFSSFAKTKYEIEKFEDDCLDYYENEIKDKSQSIIDLINNRKKGMFLFHGDKGCGKTSYIKYIINNSNKDFYYVSAESAWQFSSGQFLNFIAVNSKNSVFIFEDMEKLIMSREVNGASSVVSDILNASDGILSDVLSPIFIFTFNTEIQNIDQAFLRPGRLIMEQEFKKLSFHKSKQIAKKLNIKLNEEKEYSLAELFEKQNSPNLVTRSKRFSSEKSHAIKGFSITPNE